MFAGWLPLLFACAPILRQFVFWIFSAALSVVRMNEWINISIYMHMCLCVGVYAYGRLNPTRSCFVVSSTKLIACVGDSAYSLYCVFTLNSAAESISRKYTRCEMAHHILICVVWLQSLLAGIAQIYIYITFVLKLGQHRAQCIGITGKQIVCRVGTGCLWGSKLFRWSHIPFGGFSCGSNIVFVYWENLNYVTKRYWHRL